MRVGLERTLDGVGERRRRTWFGEDAVVVGGDDLRKTTDRRRDHRHAERQCLHHRHREAFVM